MAGLIWRTAQKRKKNKKKLKKRSSWAETVRATVHGGSPGRRSETTAGGVWCGCVWMTAVQRRNFWRQRHTAWHSVNSSNCCAIHSLFTKNSGSVTSNNNNNNNNNNNLSIITCHRATCSSLWLSRLLAHWLMMDTRSFGSLAGGLHYALLIHGKPRSSTNVSRFRSSDLT